MKILFTILILFSLSVLSQSNCDNFEAIIKEVDENYSELSQHQSINYIKHTLSKKDTFKISLFNINGELVYKINLGLLEVGTYIVKIYNPKCPGIYFVSTEIGNQSAYKKAIQITSEAFPLKEAEINTDISATINDEIWERSYSEKFIPALQPDSNFHNIEYHYKYDLQLQFSKGNYIIISQRTDENNNGKEIKTYKGKFIANGDTLKLYEDSKLKKVFQYKIDEDTLSISDHSMKDENTGAIILPTLNNIYETGIKLIGKYHK